MDIQTCAEEMIGRLDILLNQQLNRVLHHPLFQQQESAWRGLAMLVQTVTKKQRIRIRYLHLPWVALCKDMTAAAEFDQSQLFKKIYTDEFDQAGGEPFGLLIGDYYLSNKASNDPFDCLQQMAKITASAFVPFVTAVAPEFFGVDSFAEFQSTLNLERLFQTQEYHRWHRLRQDENAHFLGLVLPRILMRKSYNSDGIRIKQRIFTEATLQHTDYLWGNACYAYACTVIRCFEQTGWFMNIRGANVNNDSTSMLDLPRMEFSAIKSEPVSKIVTEFLITDKQEKILHDAGFIALRDHHQAQKSVFYSSQSVKLPKLKENDVDVTTAKINAMLHYVLCASRFAHYIKIIMRDKVGTFSNVEACETYMTRWLSQYCSSAKGQSLEAIAKNPLTKADVTVSEMSGNPGKFYCTMWISPHSQFDDIQSQLKLVTNVKLN